MNPEIERHLITMRERNKNKNYDEIVNLGWVTDAPVIINGKKYHPAILGEEFDGQALLIVQLTRWYIFRWFGETECLGFLLNKAGVLSEVDADWLMHEVGHP